MEKIKEQQFNIGELQGISKSTIDEHLKLYAGYVKNSNYVIDRVNELSSDLAGNAYEIGELQRRFGFEFNGARNHEYYFKSLEGDAQELKEGSALSQKISDEFGSFEAWLALFKQIAKTRGVGWAILYYDAQSDSLLNAWIDEQHLGQLNGAQIVLALDMWEHSFVADYLPSGKGKYIDDFFANLNWSVVEENYNQAVK